MKFHDYKTVRPLGAKGTSLDWIRAELLRPALTKQDFTSMLRSLTESSWLMHDRPFYNVYPVAVDLCQKLSLNMTWGDITLPTRYLLLRFPVGSEPLGIRCFLARAPSSQTLRSPTQVHESRMGTLQAMKSLELLASIQASEHCYGWAYQSTEGRLRDQKVFESLSDEFPVDKARFDQDFGDIPHAHLHANFIIRLLAFIGLIARGNDLITPAVLAADRDEYDATTDESRKRWLEQRSIRRQGVGFDIGRSLEEQRMNSPHWRAPHLALFHTGPGRSVPVLKVRSGCVVVPKDYLDVPTGYMGTETEEEAERINSAQPYVFRVPISKRLRFKVMRRDGFRCQICGLTQKDGVRLEVDHKTPVAMGGKNVIQNLWTLCHPCNNGKSDDFLNEPNDSELAITNSTGATDGTANG
jgi:hypothetical protein